MQYLTTEITEIVLDLLDHSQYAKHALTHLVADSANVRKAWKAWKDYIDCPLFYYGRAIHISSYFHRLPTWPRHCPGQDHNELCHRFALQRAARPARDVETLGLTTSSTSQTPMALSRRRNCQLVPDRACRLKKT